MLVTDDGHAQLHDFSISGAAGSDVSAVTQVQGSLRWQSPELLYSGGERTPQSDVWAFGIMIYEVKHLSISWPVD